MSIIINKTYKKDAITAKIGTGSKSIEIPFVPNYVRVKFEGPQLAPKGDIWGEDQVLWDLVKTTSGYRLDVAWVLYSRRRKINVQVAILQIDPASYN